MPAGWRETTLGDVCEKPEYGWTSKSVFGVSGVRYLRTSDFARQAIDWTTVPGCTEMPKDMGRYLLRDDDIVISRAGSIGASALVRPPIPAVFASYLIRFRARAGVSPRYILWFTKSPGFLRQVADKSSGIAMPNINARKLSAITIPLAPLPIQHRIVEFIEQQFSRLDVAQAQLRVSQRKLGLSLEASYRLALEAHCQWKPIAEIARTTSGGTPSRDKPENYGGSVPWIKSGELRDGRVSQCEEWITDSGLISSSAKRLPRGVLLMAMYGATIGRLGILEIEGAATNQAICAIIPHDSSMVTWLFVCLRALRKQLISSGKGGAQPNISQGIIRSLLVPVPGLDERVRLTAEIERHVSIVESALARLSAIRVKESRLRMAILHEAFSGKLCLPDIGEPAEGGIAIA